MDQVLLVVESVSASMAASLVEALVRTLDSALREQEMVTQLDQQWVQRMDYDLKNVMDCMSVGSKVALWGLVSEAELEALSAMSSLGWL